MFLILLGDLLILSFGLLLNFYIWYHFYISRNSFLFSDILFLFYTMLLLFHRYNIFFNFFKQIKLFFQVLDLCMVLFSYKLLFSCDAGLCLLHIDSPQCLMLLASPLLVRGEHQRATWRHRTCRRACECGVLSYIC